VRKLGLIAGGGQLPIDVVQSCRASGRPVFVLRLRGFADAALADFPGAEVGIAELGRQLDLLRREGCQAVCFCGIVKRPDFAQLKPDLRAIRSFPAAVAAAAKGDDALLRFLIAEFEKEGFEIEGADEVASNITLAAGPIGAVSPTAEHRDDIRLAVAVAKANGALDVGQGAVVAGGVVLAVEAQEGTDAMLGRCAALPITLRGTPGRRIGVLAKWPKPIQERRIDLPTVGAVTVEGAAAAGLAGIVAEAGATLIIDRSAVIAAADRLGLFVVGLEPDHARA
jgi:DUF1009 family protein